MELEVTAVTFPLAKPPLANAEGRRPDPPPGKRPVGLPPDFPAGKDPPLGGPPDPPPEAPPGKPPNPPVHFPVVGWLTVTVLAVTTLVFLAVVPETVTQSPTATEVAGTLTIWVKAVDVVQLTVVCPLCWLWTSMEDPVMAATEPEAPGNERVPDEPDDDEAALATELSPRVRARGRTMVAAAILGRCGARRLMVLSSPWSCTGIGPVGFGRSFGSESVDGGEPGGSGGRVDPEDQTDGDGHEERPDAGRGRERDRVADGVG